MPSGPRAGTDSRARLGLLQVSLAGVLWGTGGLAVQLVREHAPLSPLTVSAYRTGIASLVLVVAVLVLRRAAAVRALLRDRPGRAVLVGLLTATYQALYFVSVVAVGVTVATVVSLGLAPVLLALRDVATGSWHARQAPPVVAALAGLVLVSVSGHGASGGGDHPVAGLLAAVAAGATYAVATALGEPLARRADPLALTAVSTVAGTALLVPVAFLGGGPYGTTDPVAWGWLLYLGVLTFALAYGLLYAGLRTTSSSAAVVATLLEPVTAAVVAWLVLSERLGAVGWVGTVLVVGAIAVLPAPPDPDAPATTPASAQPDPPDDAARS
ncbi:MAG: EamA family transporter [Nocardioides sp.]|nr:EamA family transporter [Nocardioides sp.]